MGSYTFTLALTLVDIMDFRRYEGVDIGLLDCHDNYLNNFQK